MQTDLLQRQIENEIQGQKLGRERYLARVQNVHQNIHKDVAQLWPEIGLVKAYIPLLTEKIAEKFEKPGRMKKEVGEVHKNLQLLEPDRLAYLGLRLVVNLMDTCRNHNDWSHNSAALTATCIRLGEQIQADIDYAWMQKKAPGFLNKIENKIKDKHIGYRHQYLKKAAYKIKIYDKDGRIEMVGVPSQNWTTPEKMYAGKFLLEVIQQNTNLITIQESVKPVRNSAKRGGFTPSTFLSIAFNPEIRDAINKKHDLLADLHPVILPSLLPPKPWTGTTGGCFYSTYADRKSTLVRSHRKHVQEYLRDQDLSFVQETLNKIQSVPYRINKRVLEVMEEAKVLCIGGLPAFTKQQIEFEGRTYLAEDSPFEVPDDSPEYKAWNIAKCRCHDQWARETSKRTALIWKLKVATDFKDEPEIYFCWNMDYRGRIYPMQPYINPQMDDSGKSLIEFAYGKPLLNNDGVRWLKIHGANTFGEDKCPLADRVKWVADHEADILDSAGDPIGGSRFWCKADKPFQFLAFCLEYAGYKRDGFSHVSRLPVHTDGTCSGLQHYSALLRDTIGGRSVNLVPGETKADVYQEVATVVTDLLIADASQAENEKEKEFAKAWLKRGVDRKLVKRNVMTFCYGATKRGFASQLYTDTDPMPEGVDVFKACVYLGNKNWQAVSTVLVKAVEGMGYLQKVASFLAKQGLEIKWTTPTGFTPVQDYVKTESKQLDTWWGGVRYQTKLKNETTKKDTAGNRNAIAPNYIHSMDAAHLMLTADRCNKEGINGLSFVHDSFGTHACDAAALNRILRETFVEMYSDDLLTRWTVEVRSLIEPDLRPEFDKIVMKHKPDMGNLNLNKVQESMYFFC